MRFVFFYHSLISDWNHGNAHFLRGVASELLSRGHDVRVYEPADGWSRQNLIADCGTAPIHQFQEQFPHLRSITYKDTLDLDFALHRADVVIVHEWNERSLIERIGKHRSRNRYTLLFHDTHHRAVTEPGSISSFPLEHFDGVLAFGEVIREIYMRRGWSRRSWTWHEAADIRVFHPRTPEGVAGDVVWVGNWGDGERTEELQQYLLRPVRDLNLKARIYGVRYPRDAQSMLSEAGVQYMGWLPNYQVPVAFSRFRMTVHIPRRPYVQTLIGIPTIRVFEALACGVPLVSAPWRDVENLFRPGVDFLLADSPRQMASHMRDVIHDPQMAAELSANGLATVMSRHTCAHRVDELLTIIGGIQARNEQCKSLSSDQV